MSAQTKHSPKDIHLTGIKHAKETVCALLDEIADLRAALSRIAIMPDAMIETARQVARAAITKATQN